MALVCAQVNFLGVLSDHFAAIRNRACSIVEVSIAINIRITYKFFKIYSIHYLSTILHAPLELKSMEVEQAALDRVCMHFVK